MSDFDLSDEDRIFLARFGQEIRVPSGHYLFHDGDACSKFLLVRSGSVRVQKVSDGGRQV